MTPHETSRLLAILAAAFPRFEPDELKMQVWHEMLGDLDYSVAQLAAKKCMISNTFAPSIAEVRKAAMQIMYPQRKTAAEAWEEVNRAVDRFGYYQQQEALESLSPEVARAVRAIGFEKICLTENMGVERGQFIKIYEQMEGKQKEEQLLPDKMRAQIAGVAQRLALE